ncbi:MAG: DNA integrity scanning protein DisA [Micropruina sp.]|nr:DNA integrity scanning protein DisA [Micropruina sp.]
MTFVPSHHLIKADVKADLEEKLRHSNAVIAPGTPLRDGLDRIVHGRTGALVVLGFNDTIDSLCTGGFAIDVAFTATALRELAKMDGAIVLHRNLTRILRAGVQLMPNAAISTEETGTRHRTADRVARQSGLPVVTVSSSMSTIALYVDGLRHSVQRPEQLLARSTQALQALSRYRDRLQEATIRLSALEVQDHVTVGDVAGVAQRLEMVRRLQREIDGYVIELGVEGRLVHLQLQELVVGIDALACALERDYQPAGGQFSIAPLAGLSTDDLVEPRAVAISAGLATGDDLDQRLQARGHRQLAQVGRLPRDLADRLITRLGGLQGLFGASTSDLLAVEGVDLVMARSIREGLVRVAEAAYRERLD